ncbi:Gustatory receptor 188b [Halyomorpha halys]|nr:Gustatory receptor 188b [Halyomorpha halys]
MRNNIFGPLKYLGTPYNLKKRPGALQILVFFLTTALSIWTAWKHNKPRLGEQEDWGKNIHLTVFFMRATEATAMVFFTAKNLRHDNQLITIVEALMESGDKTNHTVWFYLGLGIALPNLLIMIFNEWTGEGLFIPPLFTLIKELILLMHVAQALVPLHAIVSRLSQIRARLYSYSHDLESNPSKAILELIVMERRLEETFNQLTEVYSEDFVHILFISTGRTTSSLCASLLVLLPKTYETHRYLLPRFYSEMISALYKIWSVAHAARLVKYQMEKFRSELYTKCLEDQSGNLAKNDMMSVFLERGLSHVSFTANGFLPLDHSLFCRMLSSAVTWVFIIIQFRIRDQ